jgi:hypothetical protein
MEVLQLHLQVQVVVALVQLEILLRLMWHLRVV